MTLWICIVITITKYSAVYWWSHFEKFSNVFSNHSACCLWGCSSMVWMVAFQATCQGSNPQEACAQCHPSWVGLSSKAGWFVAVFLWANHSQENEMFVAPRVNKWISFISVSSKSKRITWLTAGGMLAYLNKPSIFLHEKLLTPIDLVRPNSTHCSNPLHTDLISNGKKSSSLGNGCEAPFVKFIGQWIRYKSKCSSCNFLQNNHKIILWLCMQLIFC